MMLMINCYMYLPSPPYMIHRPSRAMASAFCSHIVPTTQSRITSTPRPKQQSKQLQWINNILGPKSQTHFVYPSVTLTASLSHWNDLVKREVEKAPEEKVQEEEKEVEEEKLEKKRRKKKSKWRTHRGSRREGRLRE